MRSMVEGHGQTIAGLRMWACAPPPAALVPLPVAGRI